MAVERGVLGLSCPQDPLWPLLSCVCPAWSQATCIGFYQMWLIPPGLLGPHVNIWYFAINFGFEVWTLCGFICLNSRPCLIYQSFNICSSAWGIGTSIFPPCHSRTWGISDTVLGSHSLPNSSMLQFLIYLSLLYPTPQINLKNVYQ